MVTLIALLMGKCSVSLHLPHMDVMDSLEGSACTHVWTLRCCRILSPPPVQLFNFSLNGSNAHTQTFLQVQHKAGGWWCGGKECWPVEPVCDLLRPKLYQWLPYIAPSVAVKSLTRPASRIPASTGALLPLFTVYKLHFCLTHLALSIFFYHNVMNYSFHCTDLNCPIL